MLVFWPLVHSPCAEGYSDIFVHAYQSELICVDTFYSFGTLHSRHLEGFFRTFQSGFFCQLAMYNGVAATIVLVKNRWENLSCLLVLQVTSEGEWRVRSYF